MPGLAQKVGDHPVLLAQLDGLNAQRQQLASSQTTSGEHGSSSVLAKSFPTYGPYIASKAGVEGLVHVLANELRGRNMTVNAVAPGPVPTELFLKGIPVDLAQFL